MHFMHQLAHSLSPHLPSPRLRLAWGSPGRLQRLISCMGWSTFVLHAGHLENAPICATQEAQKRCPQLGVCKEASRSIRSRHTEQVNSSISASFSTSCVKGNPIESATRKSRNTKRWLGSTNEAIGCHKARFTVKLKSAKVTLMSATLSGRFHTFELPQPPRS